MNWLLKYPSCLRRGWRSSKPQWKSRHYARRQRKSDGLPPRRNVASKRTGR
ncbi:hypothetical protein KLEB271_gp103 [Bacillus phage vB_BauS_KLEB27-1]|nr:hypothetical protein KLEB271_gp103 [Bacillus phage vB_BauS_KLEB27-1]